MNSLTPFCIRNGMCTEMGHFIPPKDTCVILCSLLVITCTYYAALLPRRGPHYASHSVCLSVCLPVCPSVPLSLPSVTSCHLANYNDTHVLFGTRWGPHIVRPSRPHRFLFYSCTMHDWNTVPEVSDSLDGWVVLMALTAEIGYTVP